MLQTQHQLNQLGLRKPLKFLPIHRQDESHTGRLGKRLISYNTTPCGHELRGWYWSTSLILGQLLAKPAESTLRQRVKRKQLISPNLISGQTLSRWQTF